jgi:hypothetical protein
MREVLAAALEAPGTADLAPLPIPEPPPANQHAAA